MTESETTPQKRVALYIRVSTEDQVEKYGIPLQKSAVLNLIKAKESLLNGGMVFAGEKYVYIDEGISGTVPIEERPEFARLQEDLINAPTGQKPFDAVAVYKIDRFARRLKVLLDVIEFFKQQKIEFLSVHESIDTATPFGRAILGIVGVIAELEMETFKERSQGGRNAAAKAGSFMGNVPPYGYTKDDNKRLKVLNVEAENVKLIFRLFTREKLSIHAIAKRLKDDDILSPDASAIKNKKRKGRVKKTNPLTFWRQSQVKKILQNEVYIGNYFYNKSHKNKSLPKSEWKLSPHKHTPIIDRLTFEKAQRLTNDTRYIKQPTSGHVYLLSGLLKCDCCYDSARDRKGRTHWNAERKEINKGSGKFSYYYRCRRKNLSKSEIGCDTLPLNAKEIEEYVVAFVKKFLESPVAVFNHQNSLASRKLESNRLEQNAETLRKIINSLPAQESRLLEQHKLGIIDSEKLKIDVEELRERRKKSGSNLEEIERQIAEQELSQGYAQTLNLFSKKYKASLKTLFDDRGELKKVLHILIEEVIVYSRSLRRGDMVAGRKTKEQKIPYKLMLKLRLPQDILQDVLAQGFGDNDSNWWVG